MSSVHELIPTHGAVAACQILGLPRGHTVWGDFFLLNPATQQFALLYAYEPELGSGSVLLFHP